MNREPTSTSRIFKDILNNKDSAKLICLRAVLNLSGKLKFSPTFDDFIKLRILRLDENKDISILAE